LDHPIFQTTPLRRTSTATQNAGQQGDAGVIAATLCPGHYGNSQMLHLEPWQPEIKARCQCPSLETRYLYRLKLQVENLRIGTVRARGKSLACEPKLSPPIG